MLKRLAFILITVVLILTSVAAAPASAQSTGNCTPQPTVQNQQFNPIISGLWAGVNLDIGGIYTISGDKITPTVHCQPLTPTQTGSTYQTPAKAPTSSHIYAALGDSVAAGVGLPNASQVPSDQIRCGRTQSAYAYEVAGALNLGLVHNACSGATTGDLFTEQQVGSSDLPPQLDAAFARGTPQLITITAGANDAHWVQLLQTCYATNCATQSQTIAANTLLASLRAKLLVLFPNIMSRSHGNPPEVIMTGYYNPVSSACTSLTQNITPEEITWITNEVTALNQTIQNAASSYSFVHFAPVDFTGHDVCSSDSWVQGMNDPQPFHPTIEGQHAYAQAVLQAR